MVQTIVSSFSLFAILLIIHNDVFVTVDAFATISKAQNPVANAVEKTTLWSSSKTSTLEEETAKDNVLDSPGLGSPESLPENDSIEEEAKKDITADADIKALMDGEEKKDESQEENLMQQIKDSGVAGVISYAAWEFAFWTVSVPVCVLGYKEVTGHWPDFQDKDDLSKLGAEAFAFVSFARFAVPLRIGLALGTTPWIQENVVDVFFVEEDKEDESAKVMVVDDSEIANDVEDKIQENVVVEDKYDGSAKVMVVDDSEIANDVEDKIDEILVEKTDVENDDKTIEMTTPENGESDSNSDSISPPSVEEEVTQPTVGRFRIRARIGNLINRILRRKSSTEQRENQ